MTIPPSTRVLDEVPQIQWARRSCAAAARGMGFKQADNLLLGRKFAPFEDSCARLPDHLFDQREEAIHGLVQALATHSIGNAGA